MEKATDDEKKKKQSGPTMSEKMFEVLNSYYHPASSPSDADDMKSTQDLMDEMEQIQEVFPLEINLLLEKEGYKLHYTGNGYVWLLRKRLKN